MDKLHHAGVAFSPGCQPTASAADASSQSGIANAVSREFHEAVESLLDWMNGNDLSADHAEQKPADFERLFAAFEAHASAIEAAAAGETAVPEADAQPQGDSSDV